MHPLFQSIGLFDDNPRALIKIYLGYVHKFADDPAVFHDYAARIFGFKTEAKVFR